MRAYYYDNIQGDQRDPHDSGRQVSIEQLDKIGVIYFNIPSGSEEMVQTELDKIAKERNYQNQDVINVSKAGLGDAYEGKIKMFFEEHLHEDEEIRYIQDGSGYFDVRSQRDDWIRIAIEKGDLLILPAGIYHRFTLDSNNYIKATRLFKAQPSWTPLNRGKEVDGNAFRQQYLKSLKAEIV